MFIRNSIFIVLMLMVVSTQATDFKRYKFPPLENRNTENNNTSAHNYMNGQVQNPTSYYRQPKYIFPELEKKPAQNYKPGYSYNDRSDKYRYPSTKQQHSEQYNKHNLRNNIYSDPYRYDSKSSYKPNYYRNNSQNNYNDKKNSYDQFNPLNQYNDMNPWSSYSSPYNSSPYQMLTPFLNNNHFQNNNNNMGWNPFSNSLSNWPNLNNGSMNNTNQNYPNIRTPGFFAR